VLTECNEVTCASAAPDPVSTAGGMTFDVRVEAIRYEALDTLSYEFRSLGLSLPTFEPGAHIVVELQNGLRRSYSLVDRGAFGTNYRIVVKKDASGRGGSRYLHESVRVGQRLTISSPRNLFPLNESASNTVLIAGGIGITPIYAMCKRLSQLGRRWTLFYAARSPEHAALAAELSGLAGGGLHMHYAQRPQEQFDIEQVIRTAPKDTHFYCCGPAAMIDTFVAQERHASGRLHFERFANPDAGGDTTEVVVYLARQKKSVTVAAHESILDALLSHGVEVAYSCREGMCGACEVRVMDGIPEHRDLILDEDQRRANKSMMVCCSRAKSPSLTLDL
jgi:tetrachlorobenzoquinone reductase